MTTHRAAGLHGDDKGSGPPERHEGHVKRPLGRDVLLKEEVLVDPHHHLKKRISFSLFIISKRFQCFYWGSKIPQYYYRCCADDVTSTGSHNVDQITAAFSGDYTGRMI